MSTIVEAPGLLGERRQGVTGDHPERIGPYFIREVLGEGGFGIVYRAEQTEPLHREVALKIIKPGMDSAQVVLRFEAERQALARMEHPNIAGVLDAGTTEAGRPYFVMELVRGSPLTDYCNGHRLTIRQRLELFIPVCQAVHHAHQKSILHRDLKPSNILVTEVDGRPVPKVIDFGIAKALGDSAGAGPGAVTMEGLVIGTPLYMSPEQAGATADIDTRSDIYTLGVILHELLIGRTPISRETVRQAAAEEILRLIREGEIRRPSSALAPVTAATKTVAEQRRTTAQRLSDTVRGDLDWILLRALEKERERRYDSARSLADDLQRHLDHEPVHAGPPSQFYRFRKLVRRHRLAFAAATAILTLLVAGITVSTVLWRHAAAERQLKHVQFERAEKEKRAAEKAQATAEGLINSMLFDLRDKLKPLGKLDLLDHVSRQAENYFKDNPATNYRQRRNELVMWSNRGQVLQDQGDMKGARAAFEKCLGIAEDNAKAFPGLDDIQEDYCISLDRMGDLAQAEGDLKGSKSAYEKSLAVRQSLASADQSNAGFQRAVSIGFGKLGDLATTAGDLADAKAAYDQSFEILKGLADRQPGDRRAQKELSVGYQKLGDVAKAKNDLNSARSQYEKSLEIVKRLLDSDSGDAQLRRGYSVALNKVGDTALLQNDVKLADEVYQQSLLTVKRLAESDPENAEIQIDLSMSLRRVGDLARKLGDSGRALSAYQQSVEIIRKLPAFSASNTAVQKELGMSLNRIGQIAGGRGDDKATREAMEEALSVYQKLAALDVNNSQAQLDLTESLRRVADLDARAGNRDKAKRSYEQCLSIETRILDSQPQHTRARHSRAVTLQRLGDLTAGLDQNEEALQFYEQSLQVFEELATTDQTNAERQQDLSLAFNRVGDIRRKAGELKQSRTAYGKSLEIVSKLAERSPGDVQISMDLGYTLTRMGQLSATEGDLKTAREAYERTLGIYQRITEKDPRHAKAQQNLSAILSRLSTIAYQEKNYPEMSRWAGKSVAVMEESGRAAQDVAEGYYLFSWAQLLERDFAGAEASSIKGLEFAPGFLPLQKNLGHALMLRGDFPGAEEIHRKNMDRKYGNRPWPDLIATDFHSLREAGIEHPDMKKIEAMPGFGELSPSQ